MEDMSFKLHEQQDWFKSHKPIKEVEERTLGHTAKNCSKMHLADMDIHQTGCYTSEKYKDLETQLESAKAKHEEITAKKSKLALENSKIKQNIEQLRSRFDDFPAELKAMDINALEEEQKALLSDKAGEMEYLQSLQERTKQIKAISEVVKCHCGQEYAVEMSQ
ncbi:switch-associated protein 70 isoform X1 [Cinnamomum micranthum f. kanehirae]|uniref:Switch-associated protein 70 isoform X1 n=1 Tax=Cinnamomum micranthum f. kanehirae TaxID=337451 RepID=A0A3S3NVX4_9MAGN|nr:switch-associated protein 70 isoform X1 [Cinnamomum micranthum f. kanehirae]